MQRYPWGVLLLTAGLLLSAGVRADIPITITATIVEPVCTVTGETGNSLVEVDFGNVQLADVNTDRAEQPLKMRVSCEGPASTGKMLKMQVSPAAGGTLSYAGEQVLGTSAPGLGIRLLDTKSQAVVPGTWHEVTGVDTGIPLPTGNVTLMARLVSENTAMLTAGAFTSSASVVMTYQ